MDTYTLAISSYALGLGEDYVTQTIALNHLNTRALGDGELWSHKKNSNLSHINTVKSALVTTCLQRQHLLFPLKMVSHWIMY